MERASSISRLPKEVREEIGRLREEGYTLDDILDVLEGKDINVSRSALGRFTRKQAQVREQVMRSRHLAEAIGKSFGGEETSKVARTNVELMHSIMMQLMCGDDDENMVTLTPKNAMFLATALEKLSKATKADFEVQLKAAEEKARHEATEKAAEKAATAARKKGLSEETVDVIKKSVLGIE